MEQKVDELVTSMSVINATLLSLPQGITTSLAGHLAGIAGDKVENENLDGQGVPYQG